MAWAAFSKMPRILLMRLPGDPFDAVFRGGLSELEPMEPEGARMAPAPAPAPTSCFAVAAPSNRKGS